MISWVRREVGLMALMYLREKWISLWSLSREVFWVGG